MSIQSQILNLLLDLRREFNLTYLFIAHNLSVVQYISDRVGVMYLGKLVELAEVDELYRRPRHPYTVALLSAVPDADPRIRKKRLVLKGDVPSPAAPPSGCRFHTRCWLREQLGNPENCTTIDPEFRDIGDDHLVACHWAEKVPTQVVAERGSDRRSDAGRRSRAACRVPGRRTAERCRNAGGGFDDERHLSIMPGSAGIESRPHAGRLGGDPSPGTEGGERRA